MQVAFIALFNGLIIVLFLWKQFSNHAGWVFDGWSHTKPQSTSTLFGCFAGAAHPCSKFGRRRIGARGILVGCFKVIICIVVFSARCFTHHAKRGRG